MAHELNADEVELQHLRTLGPDLGPMYHALYNDCAWLHVKWSQYVELFGTSQARIDLLNRGAALFFRIAGDMFLDDTLLGLTRLTDPPGLGKKKNLTIRVLPSLIADAELRREVKSLVKASLKATEFARDWRDRRIAHGDLALKLGAGATPLAPASRKRVKDGLQAVCRVIEHINEFYFRTDLRLERVAESGLTGAASLLYFLQAGLDAEEHQRERIRQGNIEVSDLQWPRSV